MQLSPDERETVPVVVAANSLGAGAVLTEADLEVVDYPVTLAPEGDSSEPDSDGDVELTAAGAAPGTIEHWVGRTLSTAVVEGQPLTGPSVVGPDLLDGQPAGTTAVTIRVPDSGSLTHLRPGQTVDLVRQGTQDSPFDRADPPADGENASASASPGGSGAADGSEQTQEVVAGDVTVLWVADPTEPADGLLSSSTTDSQQDLLVVGADAKTAQRIAASDGEELVPVLVSSDPEEPRDVAPEE